MFKINEKHEINRNILKYGYFRYSPSEISTIKTANSQMFNILPTEESVFSLLKSNLELKFDVLHAATHNR